MKLALLLILPVLAASLPAQGDKVLSAPVKKFKLPTWNAEGYRTSYLEGEEAVVVSQQQIDVKEMRYSIFSGTEENLLETTLLAPVATVRVLDRDHLVVAGSSSMRLVRKEVDASGEQWTYDHTHKKLSIGKNVRVVYQAVLKDLIR